jgi:hypothetical protein
MNDQIPSTEQYRGVDLQAWQSASRLADVRREIDHVYDLDSADQLFGYATDTRNPPEARLFAAAKVEAIFAFADNREARPGIDLDKLRSSIAGLASLHWLDPVRHGSLLEQGATRRDRPIPDGEIEAAQT